MNEKDDIVEKLPLLANGQLQEPESGELQNRLSQDPGLEQELELLKAVRRGMHNEEQATPGAMGLARLKRDIHREQKLTNKSIWKPLALTACCLVGMQTLVFSLWDDRAWVGGQPSTGMELMSGGNTVRGPQLQIVFADTATAAQLASALQSVKAAIVAGPGALGVYTLTLPIDASPSEAQAELSRYDFVVEVSAL